MKDRWNNLTAAVAAMARTGHPVLPSDKGAQPMQEDRLPASPEAMVQMLVNTAVTRVYSDLTEAARRGRLTEHDIATIERRTLGFLVVPEDVADEFHTFEVEPQFGRASAIMRNLFDACRAARVRKFGQT